MVRTGACAVREDDADALTGSGKLPQRGSSQWSVQCEADRGWNILQGGNGLRHCHICIHTRREIEFQYCFAEGDLIGLVLHVSVLPYRLASIDTALLIITTFYTLGKLLV